MYIFSLYSVPLNYTHICISILHFRHTVTSKLWNQILVPSFKVVLVILDPMHSHINFIHIHHQKQGLNREARAALLRVRTGPECPEGNLRELM